MERSEARPSNATGTSSDANAVSSGTRMDSTDAHTTAISFGAVPARTYPRISSATSSSVPRVPAPSRKRTEPSRRALVGSVGEQLALEVRERRRQKLCGARRQLEHSVAGERGKVTGRPRE